MKYTFILLLLATFLVAATCVKKADTKFDPQSDMNSGSDNVKAFQPDDSDTEDDPEPEAYPVPDDGDLSGDPDEGDE